MWFLFHAELFKGKYITEDALVWSEGLETWQPLRACHELYEAIIFSGMLLCRVFWIREQA